MSVTGVALIALLSSACGSDTGVAAPSDKPQIPVEVVTAEVTIGTESEKGRDLFVPGPTSTTERPAVVIETSEPLILSTTDDAENVSPLPTQVRREPTDTYTVHDLNTEPLVGSVFETLLAMMPDNEVTRAYTRMGDIAGTLDGLGLPRTFSTSAVEEMVAESNRLETDGFYPPIWQWPAEARDYVSIHDWYPDLAFEHGTVEQFAHSNSQFRFFGGGRQLTSYDVALGEFSALATSAAISACDCEQPEVRVYSGIDYYAWGDGTGIGQIQDRHKRPMFDHLGRGPQLLVRDGEAYYSIWRSVIDEHIDVIQGNESSLADVDDYMKAVQLVSSLGLTSEIVVRDFGFSFEQAFEGYQGQETEEETVGRAPLLLPMELVATSVGYDGKRMFAGLAISHDSSSTAEENVKRLLARLEVVVFTNYVANSGRTWAYMTDRIEIQSSGRYLIAKLYFTESRPTILMGMSNNLLLHEDQDDGRRRDD